MSILKRKPNKYQNKKPSQLSAGGHFNDAGGGNPYGGGDFWGDMFTPAGFGNDTKNFIEPGDDLDKLSMRSVFAKADPPDWQAYNLCKARYERFHQARYLNMLKSALASACSIGGASRSELLMAQTHIIAESALQFMAATRTGTLPAVWNNNGNGHKKAKAGKESMHYEDEEGDD